MADFLTLVFIIAGIHIVSSAVGDFLRWRSDKRFYRDRKRRR